MTDTTDTTDNVVSLNRGNSNVAKRLRKVADDIERGEVGLVMLSADYPDGTFDVSITQHQTWAAVAALERMKHFVLTDVEITRI